MAKRKPLLERFLEKIDKTESCWVWKSTVLTRGYGQFWIGSPKKSDLAHRVSYEIFKGPIPEGFHIDHLCRNKICVNPDHLEAVTPSINILRGIGNPAINSRKERCRRGHYFFIDSYIDAKGRRICVPCKAINTSLYRQRHPDRKETYCPIKRREKYLRSRDITT